MPRKWDFSPAGSVSCQIGAAKAALPKTWSLGSNLQQTVNLCLGILASVLHVLFLAKQAQLKRHFL
ncbi:hypothetical protein CXF74_18490 [Psychromonas sp. Urea-02u-13]|nr:hypothetical protein CXF74_18490 [Psychromonas sp. Urea-02u-13]